jgi:hypothetical protein
VTLEQIIERFQARRNGSGWISRCPAHQDRSPSLSIGEGREGRVVLHCWAGCSFESICAAAGLKSSDLFSDSRTYTPTPKALRIAERGLSDLRSRLTQRERVSAVTVIRSTKQAIDSAIARALALAVEGEIVQLQLEDAK